MFNRFKCKFLFFAFICVCYWGCKTDPAIITGPKISPEIQVPESEFFTLIHPPRSIQKRASKIVTLDSPFYFQSANQAGLPVKYEWNFGDGTKSAEQNPTHFYAATGDYVVSLTTSRMNQAFSSSEVAVSVITGEREVSFGRNISTEAITIQETDEKGFLLLGSIFDLAQVQNVTYFMLKLDEYLKQKSIVTFPASTRLATISPSNDGNYIATGTTLGSSNNTELIKTTADGTIVWSKLINCETLNDAKQTPDGALFSRVYERVSISAIIHLRKLLINPWL